MHKIFLKKHYAILFGILSTFFVEQCYANNTKAQSFSACSQVAKKVNQRVLGSGGILSQYNKFIDTYCDMKDGQLSFNYQIETLLPSLSSKERKEVKDEICSEEKRVFFELVEKVVTSYFSKQGNLIAQITVTKNSCVE